MTASPNFETKKSKSEKSRPLEFSCRAPVSVPKPKRQGLMKRRGEDDDLVDPRFNREVGGEYNPEMFGKAYGFLDEYRVAEKRDLSDKLTRGSRKMSSGEKIELSRELSRMESQDVARSRVTMETEVRKELKRQELEVVAKTGKRAYYHPRSLVKKIIQEKKENDLDKRGQLDRYKSKQERRKTSSDRRMFSIPKTRRVVDS